MPDTIETFDTRVDACASLGELEALLTREVRRFGIDSYALGVLSDPEATNRLMICTWPSGWLEHYAINNFAAEDIVVREARNSTEPFTWAQLKRRYPGVGDHLYAAAGAFDWVDGYVVPWHRPDGSRAIVSYTARRPLTLSDADRAELTVMSLAALRQAEDLFNRPSPQPLLSARERDALALVAQGLDDGEIGAKLGVTRTTAHAHVERAKRRLGASTRAQAVAIAVGRRLI